MPRTRERTNGRLVGLFRNSTFYAFFYTRVRTHPVLNSRGIHSLHRTSAQCRIYRVGEGKEVERDMDMEMEMEMQWVRMDVDIQMGRN